MPKWIVPFEGKLIVEAGEEKDAKEIVNVFLTIKGLPGTKAKSYGCEQLDEAMIVSKSDKQPVDIERLVNA